MANLHRSQIYTGHRVTSGVYVHPEHIPLRVGPLSLSQEAEQRRSSNAKASVTDLDLVKTPPIARAEDTDLDIMRVPGVA